MYRRRQLYVRILLIMLTGILVLPAAAVAAPARQDGQSGFPTAVMDQAYFLNVRSGPGVAYPVVTTIARGAVVSLTGYRAGSWVSVRLEGGTEGWVNFNYMSSTFPLTSLAQWEGESGVEGRSGFPTAKMDQAYALNVRSGPGIGYGIITAIPRGTVVELTGYRDASATWVTVRLPNGSEGWVNGRYLSSDFPYASLAPAGEGATVDGRSSLPTATVSAAYALNVRTGPGTGYPIVTAVLRGTVFELTGYRNAAGNWVSVRLPDGREGWAHAGYLTTDFPLANLAVAG